MEKIKVVAEWRETPILFDGCRYYVEDGLGDIYFFNCIDDAIAHIEGFDLIEEEGI